MRGIAYSPGDLAWMCLYGAVHCIPLLSWAAFMPVKMLCIVWRGDCACQASFCRTIALNF